MRDAEAILPNIHLDAGESPSATINYDLGGQHWSCPGMMNSAFHRSRG